MKFAFFGYDFFSNILEAMLSRGHELVELFTAPMDEEYDFTKEVLKIAGKAGARITFSKPGPEDMKRLRDGTVNLILSAAYPYKIPEWQGFVEYAINVHPSLLPEGRGPWPMPWAILNGDKTTGVSLHEISAKFDEGAIVDQRSLPVTERDNLTTLSVRLQLLAGQLVVDTLDDLDALWQSRRPQTGGSYFKMPARKDRTIDWGMTVSEIDRIFRAFHRFEPFIYLDQVRHFVRGLETWQEAHAFAPGTCVRKTARETTYAVVDGFVTLTQVTRADELPA